MNTEATTPQQLPPDIISAAHRSGQRRGFPVYITHEPGCFQMHTRAELSEYRENCSNMGIDPPHIVGTVVQEPRPSGPE